MISWFFYFLSLALKTWLSNIHKIRPLCFETQNKRDTIYLLAFNIY